MLNTPLIFGQLDFSAGPSLLMKVITGEEANRERLTLGLSHSVNIRKATTTCFL